MDSACFYILHENCPLTRTGEPSSSFLFSSRASPSPSSSAQASGLCTMMRPPRVAIVVMCID